MEDDDEFGDLYSDVIPSFTTSVGPQLPDADLNSSQNRPTDRRVAGDDDEILYGASQLKNSNSGLGLELDAPILGKNLTGRFDSNLVASAIVGGNISSEGLKLPEKAGGELNFMKVDDDDLNFVVEDTEPKNGEVVEERANVYSSAERSENAIDHVADSEEMIPVPSGETENRGGAMFENEWESDESEDDLQIVLNDNHVQMRIKGMEADDEDGEALLIVADNGDLSGGLQQTEMEERERGGEEGADAERNELVDIATAAAASTAAQPKIGYSNHMYHHQPYHSQFKVNHLCPMRTSILIGF